VPRKWNSFGQERVDWMQVLQRLIRIWSMTPNDSGQPSRILERELSFRVINAFYEVYNSLGFGYLESVYSKSLELALRKRDIHVDREVPVQVFFDGHVVGSHRIDLLVGQRIIVEVKSTEVLSKVALRQLRSYLATANLELGLLLHFGASAKFCRVLARKRSRAAINSDNAPNSDA
jgi:GxxExxY protein